MKRALKSFAGRLIYGVGAHRRAMKDTAVVTAFHRIADQESRDAITVGVREFDTFCRLAGNYFDVISLSDLLERLEHHRDISNSMVITFDDGYEDNHAVAAPTLARWGLPATFFIATDFIGTEYQPYWDRDNGIQTRWMTWEQVCELHAQGFEIGAHTRTHANLAGLSLDAARDEILGSKVRLEQALGTTIDLFSYPFGGQKHCTDDVRALVAELGFRCCPSCHGGLVRAGDDPFRLFRMPVNKWYAGYWHFSAEVLLDLRQSRSKARSMVPEYSGT